LTLKPLMHFQAAVSYAGMISKTANGNYTPYNPAQKMTPSLQYNTESRVLKNIHLFTTFDYYFAQDHVAPFELATPAYGLWNLGASAVIQGNRQVHEISIAINNLLDEAYYDHLSRFKYFGLLNMGRNIVVSYKIIFGRPVKEK
jgi:iron complex outermembrane recepter protein